MYISSGAARSSRVEKESAVWVKLATLHFILIITDGKGILLLHGNNNSAFPMMLFFCQLAKNSYFEGFGAFSVQSHFPFFDPGNELS